MLKKGKAYTLIGTDGKPYLSAAPGMFGGHRRGKLYGRLDCRAACQAIARGGYVKHRVFFLDEETAIAAGYRPCAVCMPDQYAIWKKSFAKSLAGDREKVSLRDLRDNVRAPRRKPVPSP